MATISEQASKTGSSSVTAAVMQQHMKLQEVALKSRLENDANIANASSAKLGFDNFFVIDPLGVVKTAAEDFADKTKKAQSASQTLPTAAVTHAFFWNTALATEYTGDFLSSNHYGQDTTTDSGKNPKATWASKASKIFDIFNDQVAINKAEEKATNKKNSSPATIAAAIKKKKTELENDAIAKAKAKAAAPAPEPTPPEVKDKIDHFDWPIKKAVLLAKELDGDVDGQRGNGTSSVREGSESFIFGANYTGLRGANISEVSGLSASYVTGKRVSWLDGDSFSFQNTGSSSNIQNCSNIESTVFSEGKISSETYCNNEVISKTKCKLDSTSIRISAANVATIQIGGTTTETLIFGGSVHSYTGITKTVINPIANLNIINFSALMVETSLIGLKLTTEVISQLMIRRTTGPQFEFNDGAYVKTVTSQVGMTVNKTESIGSSTLKTESEVNIKNNTLSSTVINVSKISSELVKKETELSSSEMAINDLKTQIANIANDIKTINSEIISSKISVQKVGLSVVQ
jgi:hypothetical protein